MSRPKVEDSPRLSSSFLFAEEGWLAATTMVVVLFSTRGKLARARAELAPACWCQLSSRWDPTVGLNLWSMAGPFGWKGRGLVGDSSLAGSSRVSLLHGSFTTRLLHHCLHYSLTWTLKLVVPEKNYTVKARKKKIEKDNKVYIKAYTL